MHDLCFQGLPLPEEVSSDDESSSDSGSFFGRPVLELFLTKSARGELRQQGTVLSLPIEDKKKPKREQLCPQLLFSKVSCHGITVRFDAIAAMYCLLQA